MRHPSLDAAFVPPGMIHPVKLMDPYKPCWCGGGKKYKFCHFRREGKVPASVFQLGKAMLEQRKHGQCSYAPAPGAVCHQPITDAHTVQRRGALAAIAESNHVLELKPSSIKSMIDHKGTPPPHQVGVRRASTFPGFCNEHDSIFGPIEGRSIVFDRHTTLLFAFRAICYERYIKELQLKAIPFQREMDMGKPFKIQAAIQELLHIHEVGAKQGLIAVDACKAEYNDRVRSGALDDLHFWAVTFDRVLPVAACGAFYPEFDFSGVALQKLGNDAGQLETITMNIAVFEGRTSLVFVWLGQQDGPASAFVRSFAKLDRTRMADATVRVAYDYLENVYARPSWWSGLNPDSQAKLITASFGEMPGKRRANSLVSASTCYAEGNVVSVTTS